MAGRCSAPGWSSRSSGFAFGLVIFLQLRKLPVHRSMREISELIYETCKTYLVTQGKFILMLEAVHRPRDRLYFGRLATRSIPRPAGVQDLAR